MQRYVNQALIYSFLLMLPLKCEASGNEAIAANRPRVISQNPDIMHLILNPEELAGKKLFYYHHNTEFFLGERDRKEKPIKLEFLKAEYKRTRQSYFDTAKPDSTSKEDKEGVMKKLRAKNPLTPRFDEQNLTLSVMDSVVVQAQTPKTVLNYELVLYFKQLKELQDDL